VLDSGVVGSPGDELADGVAAGMVGLASVAAAAGNWLAPDGAFKSVAVQLASTSVERAIRK